MTALTLHFAPFSCALVSLIALEETGHPYQVELVDLAGRAQRSAGYLALNPAGKVPVLVVDGAPLTETVAILTFLAGRFPDKRLLPDPGDFRGRVEVLSDLAFCSSTLQPFTPRIRLPERFCDADPARVRTQAIDLARLQLDWVERRLASGWWYGADWSLVDAHVGWVFTAVTRDPGLDPATYPNLRRHQADGLARPAVQRAVAIEQDMLRRLGR